MIFRREPPKKIEVACPSCGHLQQEYAATAATACRRCGERFPVAPIAKARPQPAKVRLHVERREIGCRQCGHLMTVPAGAMSWQCPACSTYLDFKDHVIDRESTVAIQTYGSVTVESRGISAGSRIDCQTAEIAGRVLGRLSSGGAVVLSGDARLQGGATGKTLEVQSGARAEAALDLKFEEATVAGTLKARRLSVRRLTITAEGSLEAESLELATLTVERGGRLEARTRVRPSVAQAAGTPEAVES